MKNKVKILLVMIGAVVSLQTYSQDLHFSQFFETPMLRNPALAGIFNGDIRVQGVYRDQWNSVTTGYRTASLNGEYKMAVGNGDDYMTLGMQLFYDKAGTVSYSNTQVLPGLNYHKSINPEKNTFVSLGFMGGWVQHHIDISKITTNSMYDGMGLGENISNPSYSYLDGSVGMSFNSSFKDNPDNNIILGAAYHHFNRPKNSFYKNKDIEVNPKWVFSGSLRLSMNDYSFVSLHADHSRQGSFNETLFGAMFGHKLGDDPENPDYIISGGTFMRWNDALIPVIKLDYFPFAVSFSYDANISKLKPSSHGRGGFEIAISFIKKLDNGMYGPRF